MMRNRSLLCLGRFIKSIFHRCKEDGCWKKGMSVREVDLEATEVERMKPRAIYWHCREHVMKSSRGEA